MKFKLIIKINIFFIILFSSDLTAQETIQKNKIYSVSLEEATRLAFYNNFDIQIAKYDALIAQTQQDVAESLFDTFLNAEANYQNNQNKNATSLLGTKTLDNNYNIGVSKKLPTGTYLDVNFRNNRNWTNSLFSTTNPTHTSFLELGLIQELGKNFFGIQDRGLVKITTLNIENSGYTSHDLIEYNIYQVQNAYWDLVLQKEIVEIKQDIVSQAKRLYDIHQEKLKDGLVELPEAIASEANYKNRISELELAKNQVKLKQNVLKLFLNIEDEDILIQPTDNLIAANTLESKQEALSQAFQNRMDYKKIKNEIKISDIELILNKNNLWPEVNLTASFNHNGLGDHFKQSIRNIIEEDNQNFFTGLTVSFPIENRKAKAQLKASELEKAKVLLNFKLIERQIMIAIIDQLRDCKLYKEIAKNNEEVAYLQSKKLEEEEKRFNTGRSNTDTLIRFQEDFTFAKENAVYSKFRYVISLINLERVKGTLLTKYLTDQ